MNKIYNLAENIFTNNVNYKGWKIWKIPVLINLMKL